MNYPNKLPTTGHKTLVGLALVFVLVFLLGSCASQADRVLSSRSDDLVLQAKELSADLIQAELRRNDPDKVALEDLLKTAQALMQEAWGSPELRSWFAGLEVWALDLSGRQAELKTARDSMARRYPQAEWTRMAKLLELASKPDRAQALVAAEEYLLPLESEPQGVLPLARILAARLYLAQGLPGKALAQWDALINQLDPQGRGLAEIHREAALMAANAALTSVDSMELYQKTAVNFDEWWSLAQAETGLLERLGWKPEDGQALLPWFKAQGLLPSGFVDSSSSLARRDLAYILFHTFLKLRKDPYLEGRYAEWKAKAQVSPGSSTAAPKSLLPDVDYRSYYYFAAVLAIERQFMTLPDGTHFIPEGPVEGKAALDASKALDSQTKSFAPSPIKVQ